TGEPPREYLGPAGRHVVPVHARDDHVCEPHALDRFRQPDRLVRVEWSGGAVRYRAVGAVARADVAQDHEGRGLVLPALADVGAMRRFADGVELQLAHQLLQGEVVGPPWSRHPEPGGLAGGDLSERAGHGDCEDSDAGTATTGQISTRRLIAFALRSAFHTAQLRIQFSRRGEEGVCYLSVFRRFILIS